MLGSRNSAYAILDTTDILTNRLTDTLLGEQSEPHTGVFNRDFSCYIYIYVCMYVFDCLWKNNTKKLYAKMRGRNYILQTRACSKIGFGSLKRSADYNFSLEFLILLSPGWLKPTCDILIIFVSTIR